MEKRIKKYSASSVAVGIALYVSLALIALVCVLPMWHVVMASISDPMKFGVYKGFLFYPLNWKVSFEAYKVLFTNPYLWGSYLNTIFYTFASVALGLFLSVMAAYALSAKKMLFQKPLLVVILVTMFFNGGMIPFYIVVKQLGLTNTAWSMILPTCCSAMNVVMLRNGLLSVPEAVREAAEIDGAGPFTLMLRIMIPLIVPFIVVVALFNGVANWNSWVNASLFIKSEHKELYPLQLILRDILTENSPSDIFTDNGLPVDLYVPGVRMAAVVVASLPIIIAYPFLQKHFEKGVIIGSVKG